MISIESEFNIQKVCILAKSYGLIFCRRASFKLPTFNVFDEYLDGSEVKIATVQWVGDRWACIDYGIEISAKALERVFAETNSIYFWEIHG